MDGEIFKLDTAGITTQIVVQLDTTASKNHKNKTQCEIRKSDSDNQNVVLFA